MDRLVKNVSLKAMELYETVWKFFGPEWDHLKLNLKGKGEERQREEQIFLNSCKISLAKAKLSGRKISPVSQNIYIRVANTFFNFLFEEGIFKSKLKLPFIEEPAGDFEA